MQFNVTYLPSNPHFPKRLRHQEHHPLPLTWDIFCYLPRGGNIKQTKWLKSLHYERKVVKTLFVLTFLVMLCTYGQVLQANLMHFCPSSTINTFPHVGQKRSIFIRDVYIYLVVLKYIFYAYNI